MVKVKKTVLCYLLLISFFFSACGSASEDARHRADMQASVICEEPEMPFSGQEETVSAQQEPTDRILPEQEAVTGSGTTTCSLEKETQESADQKGIHYFTFHRTQQIHTNDSGIRLLEQTLTKPVFYAENSQLNEWVTGFTDHLYLSDAAYGQDLLSYAESDFKEKGEDEFYTHSYYVSMGIGRHDDQIISLLSLSSSYSGGDHPYSIQTAHNLDLENMRVLKLEDVVTQEGAVALTKLVQSAVESRFSSVGEGALFEDCAQTIAVNLSYGNMTPYWYFNAEGMVVFFNQYTLGPNTSGIVRIQIDYEELDGIIFPEFFPENVIYSADGLSIDSEPTQGERVFPVNFSAGETVYMSITGRANCVQFSRISWAGQVPVGENMLFSANYIDDATTLAVTGDFLYDDQIYALEYSDQHGDNIRYVVNGEIKIDPFE